MGPNHIGYEFLSTKLQSGAFSPNRPARVRPVTKVVDLADVLAIPAAVAITGDNPIEHLQFALKHEGLDLAAVMLALKRIESGEIARAFMATPSSIYIRQIAYLWEIANKTTLNGLGAATGPYVQLFDPQKYVTGSTVRNQRWRVDFNGIGSPAYCPTVRRTAALQKHLQEDILTQTQEFIDGLDKQVLDRAVRWAYLSETRGSYAIEQENPSASKAEAFASLLSRAHTKEAINEEYLVALQNITVSNPLDKAFQYRDRQNWLKNALPGAIGVTYLPPPPETMLSIMSEIEAMANEQNSTVDPIVRGALVSFGFVFAHPFMDGNGRLSRFLFHKVVCSSGKLPNGMVLPVSVAMKRNENQYLQALESFSRPTRNMWNILSVDEHDIHATFNGDPDLYRYWDATDCVTFGLEMAQQALDRDLRTESDFLKLFDAVYRAANEAVDMNNNDLVNSVRACLENNGTLSNNRRKQLIAKGHPASVIDSLQDVVRSTLEALNVAAEDMIRPTPER